MYTSPMLRTMQTTVEMFKNHPNVANIRFVVVPLLREVLNIYADVAMDVNVLMKRYAHGARAA